MATPMPAAKEEQRRWEERQRQSQAKDAKPAAILISAANVRPEAVDWLWAGRVPRGAITVLEGPPGLGKTTLALDLAARVSSGHAMPGCNEGAPSTAAIVASLEDALPVTIVPRLIAAGADLDRVQLLEGIGLTRKDMVPLSLPDHLAELEGAIRSHKAGLAVVDPLMAALSGAVDSYRDQDVRAVLSKLRSIAEGTGCAIVIIRHLRKAPGLEAISAGQGSIGIAAAARSVLLLARHPNAEGECVLAHVKCNVGPLMSAQRVRPVPAMAGEVATSCLEWLGEAPGLTADQLVAPPVKEEPEDRSALAEAQDFLKERLADGARHLSKSIQKDALDAGIARKTFHRARKSLPIAAKQFVDPETDKRGWYVWWTGPVDHQPSGNTEAWPSTSPDGAQP